MNKNLYEELAVAEKFFLIAGPCVIENRDITLNTAETLLCETQKRNIKLVFKSSWKKANRTSLQSYTGPGIDEGLKILQEIKNSFDLPIITDFHETQEAPIVAEVADILQIPAFLSRQTDLLIAAGSTNRIVNIKKGQFMAPEDMQSAAEKITSSGNDKILICERGTSFGYHNLVVDFRSFSILQSLGYPVVYDVTHSLQQPSAGITSGGTPQFIEMMARAAIATSKVRGLFIETHPKPESALSDAASMLPLNRIGKLLDDCLQINNR